MPYDVLSGLKVLDLSQRLAGSFCAKILGSYGCEVVKVAPLGGDPIRLKNKGFTKKHPDRRLMDVNKAATYIKWVLDQPKDISLNELSIDPKQILADD